MQFWHRIRWFQKTVVAVMTLFFGIMIIVTIVAYGRRSGSTGLDMAKVQKMRYDAQQSQIVQSE